MADERPDETPRKNSRLPITPNGGMLCTGGVFGCVLFAGLAIMLLNQNKKSELKVKLPDFTTYMKAGKVQSITIDADELRGDFNKSNR